MSEARTGRTTPGDDGLLGGIVRLNLVVTQVLEGIAGRLGVPREEVVAFGDGDNDLTMFAYAGRSVGVGSLQRGVAEAIDEHIPGPEALGIVDWLEQNL